MTGKQTAGSIPSGSWRPKISSLKQPSADGNDAHFPFGVGHDFALSGKSHEAVGRVHC
jgi:hypothetical protein